MRTCPVAVSASSTTSVPVSLCPLWLLCVLTQITGTRGATSAEYFLKAGYAVIFMHRQFSLQPFSRHYSHSTHPFLDFLEIEDDARISVTEKERAPLLEVLTAYKSAHMAGLLHTLTFVTVNDYLWLLRAVSQELAVLGRRALYYLAAAVSDFFLPRQKMVSRFQNHALNDIDRRDRVVRAQDTVRKGQPTHRDGSSAKDPEAPRI